MFSTDPGTPCFPQTSGPRVFHRPRRPGTPHPYPALSTKPSVNASRSDIGTVPLFLACVASVSNRVIARKLEREQKKRWKGDWEGRRGSFFPLPLTRHSFFFLALDELARKRLLRRLLYFSRPPPPGAIIPNARSLRSRRRKG